MRGAGSACPSLSECAFGVRAEEDGTREEKQASPSPATSLTAVTILSSWLCPQTFPRALRVQQVVRVLPSHLEAGILSRRSGFNWLKLQLEPHSSPVSPRLLGLERF